MKVGLFIPTYMSEADFRKLSNSLEQVKDLFHRRLVIDSSSTDNTVEIAKTAGFEVVVIPSAEFDHGTTRQLGVEILDDCELIFFLTQDAIVSDRSSIENMLEAFNDPDVVIAYGRQLPRQNATLIEAHARIFSYPSTSVTKSKALIPELGLRTAVVSNSFAAYRRSVLLSLGGFPSGTLFGEDTLTGAKAILSGYKIAYVGDAIVYHSHGYTLAQEFRRYFDNGVFYRREKWIIETFGKAEGSGKAYVISEIRYILKNAPLQLFRSVVTTMVKYLGYTVGRYERFFSPSLKLHFSMNRPFWRREIAQKR